MHSQEPTHGNEKRASAEGQNKGRVAHAAVQRYKDVSDFGPEYLQSDVGNLLLSSAGNADHFFAKPPAAIAGEALEQKGSGPGQTTKFGANPTIDFVANCYAYCNNVSRAIKGLEKGDVIKRTTTNLDPQQEAPESSFKSMFGKVPTPAQPQLGEVYFAIGDWDDKEVSPAAEDPPTKFYNMHWATVVGQDGSDVATVESSPSASAPFFKLYNHYKEAQTFKQHYISLGNFKENYKVYALQVSKGEKPPQSTSNTISIED